MAWTVRCRGPSGQTTLSGVDASASLLSFLERVAEATGVPVGQQQILAGFPPKPLEIVADPGSTPLGSWQLTNGDIITVRKLDLPPPVTTPPPAAATPAVPDSGFAATGGEYMSEDELLARAIAASLAEVSAPAATSSGETTSAPARSKPQQGARTEIPLSDGQIVVRRVIDSDNSCLFNAIGYVMQHNRKLAPQLRQVIADVVSSNPEEYSEAFLGKTNPEYCAWITQPDKWGGGIELAILSTYFGREIAAFDIQTKRVDVYGQDAGYDERVFVLYDGLHYDAIAVSPVAGAPDEMDITQFNPNSPDFADIEAGARKLVEEAHNARQFTDVANFTLRCGVCQIGIKGEKEAREHAKATGHQNFCEY